MKISSGSVDLIKERADVLEVVQDFISLKKSGANWWGCCPFHFEKTPSFSINPSKGFYKCFGCGKSGDAITFVMEHEQMSFPESLVYLAKKYNIDIETDAQEEDSEAKDQQKERDSILIALDFALKHYHQILITEGEGKIGLSYFQERGFGRQAIEFFELGYSLDQWDDLFKSATKAGYSKDILLKAGLITEKEGKSAYDRFRARVMFPIHNLSGKVIAFGARLLSQGSKQAKYLNSPETIVYHKGQVLYGLFQAKQSIRQADTCYMVEGYTDVISLWQAGIKNVVASSGTSLTVEQIRLLSRFTKNITILYDGDTAGLKASLRGVDLIIEEGLNVRIVVLPEGEDPDSWVKKEGAQTFQSYIQEKSKDFISFKTELLLKDVQNDPIKKSELIYDLVQTIVKIPEILKREVFYRQVSELLQVDEQMLISEGNKILLKGRRKETDRPKESSPEDSFEQEVFQQEEEQVQMSPLMFPEKYTIFLLLMYSQNVLEDEVSLGHYLLEELSDLHFETAIYQEIWEVFKSKLKNGKMINFNYFIKDHDNDRLRKAVLELVSKQETPSHNWLEKYNIHIPKDEEMLPSLAFKAILRTKIRHVRKMIQDKMQQIAELTDVYLQEKLLQEIMNHKETEKEMALLLGNVLMR